MRTWIWIVLAVLSLGLTAYGLLRPRAEQGLPVNVVRAEDGAFVREARAVGVVEAQVYTLSFARPGRVAEVRVQEGQRVPTGALLALLQTAEEEARLQAARAALGALQARMAAQEAEYQSNRTRLQNQLEQARHSLVLSRQLLAVGGVAANEVVQLERQVADLEAQLASLARGRQSAQQELKAQMAARQSEVASLEQSLAQARLRAPVAGTVASVGFRVGLEASGAIRLIEAGSLRVQARLAEAELPWVRPGQPVRIELDAVPEEPLEGQVERLGVQAELAGSGGSAVVPVFVRFLTDRAEALARPGLTATARITTLRLAQAVRIPLEALVEEEDQRFVWQIDPTDRRVRKQPVELLARNLTQAAVKGVEAGALLVSLPPQGLKEGVKVSYRLPEEKAP